MTFEEFKKGWEVFSIIDTEEKLEICKNRYEDYLMRLEDDNFFEPVSVTEMLNNPSILSEKVLHTILKSVNITESNVFLFVSPSFSAPYLMIIEQDKDSYKLLYTVWEGGSWSPEIQSSINTESGEEICRLLEKTIALARAPRSKYAILDGTTFYLFKRINGEVKLVCKNQVEGDSGTGKIIGLLEMLVSYIIPGTDAVMEGDIKSRLEELITQTEKK